MYEQKQDYDITTANGLTADMKTLERYLLVNFLWLGIKAAAHWDVL